MSRATLLYVRFFVPAVILVVLTYTLAKVMRLTHEAVPVNANDLGYNLGYLIIAAIYQYLPIRGWFNAPFRADVDERIRSRLVKISGLPDDPKKFAWSRVANVFYFLIDNDKSLEKRSDDVMFNGALMTSFADLSAISFALLICIVVAGESGLHAGRASFLLLALLVISVGMQGLARRRHIKLADYQLDYIEQVKKADVTAQMTGLSA